MKTRLKMLGALAALSLQACPLADDGASVPGLGDPAEPTSIAAPTAWTRIAGPCPGSQTNALHFDPGGVGFIGCGENGDGTGLFRSDDGGAAWTSIATFDQIRISDIRRSPDGTLVLAGKDTRGPGLAWRYDPDADVTEVLADYAPRAPFLRISHAENIVERSDGGAIIDSLTGLTMAWRAPGEADFVEIESATASGESISVRRLGLLDGRFFGVGGNISDPPQVFVESTDGAPVFERVDLGDGNDGELYAMGEAGGGVLVGGWDQTDRHPLLFRTDGAVDDPAAWIRLDLTAQVEKGAIRGLCVRGDSVMVVGDRFPTSAGGFALFSTDGGSGWTDVTPPDAGVISRCHLAADGTVFVAGAGGFAAIGR